MKINTLYSLKSLAIASVFTLGLTLSTGCKKDGCTDINAENYDEKADEDDGTCTYVSDKFVGTYLMSEIETAPGGEPEDLSYTLTIEQDAANMANVRLKRLSNFTNANVLGTVSGNVITFTNQTVGSFTVSGSLSLSGSTITSIYSIENDGTTTNVTGTGIKQN